MLTFICRLLLGGLYVAAAAGKLHNPRAFFRTVIDYQQVPGWAVPWVSAALPGIEMLAGAVLLVGAFVALFGVSRQLGLMLDAAAWIVAGLLAIFAVSLSVNLLRGVSTDCGCFDLLGSSIPILGESKVTWWTVVRDLVMLAFAAPLLLRRAGEGAGRK